KVVEDAAQGIGARYKDRTAGSMGDLGCFSFYPSKNLGAAGDAGMITTNDDRLDGICRDLRVHGANPKYFHRMVGYNSRMDSIQGAILLIKLKHLNSWHEARREKSHKYNEMFALPEITTPKEMEYNYQIYHQYTIRVPKRDELREYLKSKSIGCEVYYPLPLHRQKCYEYLGYGESSLSESEKASKEVISIPVFPELTDSEQAEVVETIEGFFK
ncbi:MAG: transcriptional regulator, partial [candidate division Zixibacteria bacterium]|nr:transcriptional regulator [candidate division Zixibacteria bacterium]